MISYNPEYNKRVRYRRKFILWPRTFNGVRKWLEYSWFKETYGPHCTVDDGCICFYDTWSEEGFATEEVALRRLNRLALAKALVLVKELEKSQGSVGTTKW